MDLVIDPVDLAIGMEVAMTEALEDLQDDLEVAIMIMKMKTVMVLAHLASAKWHTPCV